MKLGFKRGQKGFTLVELMVVMAIMAVLASIVVPAVTGTKQVSLDSQVKQDAGVIETAVGSYNADANLAELLTTDNTTNVVGESATQIISSKWPELKVTAAYSAEFPTSTTNISAVIIKDSAGSTLYSTGGASGHRLANYTANYTALDSSTLFSEGYIQEEPSGVDRIFSSSKPYHNYLWLLEKVAVGADTDGGRVLSVFSLISVAISGGTDQLTYQQVY